MALSANTPIKYALGDKYAVPLSNVHAYEGSMCFRDANGDAVLAHATGTLIFLGHAIAEVDNSAGSAGAVNIELRGHGKYAIEAAVVGVTADTDGGADVYAADDGTLTLTSTDNSKVGTVLRRISGTTCLVEMIPEIAPT